MISARVAPLGRATISRIFVPLLSARGAVALVFGLGGLLASLGLLLGRRGPDGFLGLWRARFTAGTVLRCGLLGRDVRDLFRDGGGSVVGFCVRHIGLVVLFWRFARMTIDHPVLRQRQENGEQSFACKMNSKRS
jgi:hypothetical protein